MKTTNRLYLLHIRDAVCQNELWRLDERFSQEKALS